MASRTQKRRKDNLISKRLLGESLEDRRLRAVLAFDSNSDLDVSQPATTINSSLQTESPEISAASETSSSASTSHASFTLGNIPTIQIVEADTLSFTIESPSDEPLHVDVLGPWTVEEFNDEFGTITFNSDSGRLDYTPLGPGQFDFDLRIYAGDQPTADKTQVVTISSGNPKSDASFVSTSKPIPNPESGDYITVSELATARPRNFKFNGVVYGVPANQQGGSSQDTTIVSQTRDVKISGKTVVFEPGHINGLYERFGSDGATRNNNISDLTIAAETLVIAGNLRFPGTNVTVFANTLEFRDSDEHGVAKINTTPIGWRTAAQSAQGSRPGANGHNGQDGGDLTLNVVHLNLPSENGGAKRFVLSGSNGQKAGEGKRGTDRPRITNNCRVGHGIAADPIGNNWLPAKPPTPYWQFPRTGVVVYAYRTDGGEKAACGSRSFEPKNGGNAIAGGRPGNGGNGGQLTTTLASSIDLTSNRSGDAGLKAKNQRGGVATALPGGATTAHFVKLRKWCEDSFFGLCLNHDSTAEITRTFRPRDGKGWTASGARSGVHGQIVQTEGDVNTWLHPSSLQSMLAVAKDTYLDGNLPEAREALVELDEMLVAARPFREDVADRMDVLHTEVASLAAQTSNQLDYFGNPEGWAPTLSFAANLSAFEAETEASIQTLFLSRLIEKHANSKQLKIATIERALQQLDANIELATKAFNDAQSVLPDLEVELEQILAKTEIIEVKIANRESQLLQQAKDNLDPPWWKKGIDILGPVLQAVPVPWVSAVGAGVTTISKIHDKDWGGAVDAAKGIQAAFKTSKLDKATKAAKEKLDQMKPPSTNKDKLKEFVKDVAKIGKEYAPAFKALRQGLKGKEIPQTEIEQELAKLKAEDTRLNDLIDLVSEITAKKALFVQKLAETTSAIGNAITEISASYATAETLNVELSNQLDGLRPETVDAAKDMESRARSRLTNFQYLMAKAFEYETLTPYSGDLKVQRLMDSVIRLVNDSDDPTWLDTPDNFESLRSVFEDQIRDIADQIWRRLNNTTPRLTSEINYRLSQEQVQQLNQTGRLPLNLLELGIVDPAWEDTRILNLRVADVQSTLSGGFTQTANVRFEFLQPEESVFQLDGHQYRFRHPEESLDRALWATDYDATTENQPRDAEVSPRELAAIEKLIDVDLDTIDADATARLRSSPSAWSEIELRKFDIVVPSSSDVMLDNVTLSIRLDFERPDNELSVLDLRMADDVSARFNVSTPDQSGNTDGIGDFVRFYEPAQSVRVTAEREIGQSKFVEWQNAAGEVISSDRTIVVDMTRSHQLHPIFAPIDAERSATSLVGDLNQDGTVGFPDFLVLSSNFGAVDAAFSEGDLDGDGIVGFADFLLLTKSFSAT